MFSFASPDRKSSQPGAAYTWLSCIVPDYRFIRRELPLFTTHQQVYYNKNTNPLS
jgi:hypothetical protein